MEKKPPPRIIYAIYPGLLRLFVFHAEYYLGIVRNKEVPPKEGT